MEKSPQEALDAVLASEQSIWALRVKNSLDGARRDLDRQDQSSVESPDAEGYAVLVRAFQRADDVLTAMRPAGR